MLAYWTISDLYEEFKNKLDILSFQEGNYGMLLRGDASYPNSWDIPKPVFQVYRLLHRLGDFEVKSTGGTIENGVNAIATCDSSKNSLQILLYNHFVSETQSSAPADEITLNVNNIPWTSGKAVVEHHVIDTTHSNTHTAWVKLGKPKRPSKTQWDKIRAASTLEKYDSTTTVNITSNSYTKKFNAHYYSVHLITLRNPESVSVHKSSLTNRTTGNLRILGVKIRNGKIILNAPFTNHYTVNLFTTDGRVLLTAQGFGQKNKELQLPKLAHGMYILQCRGAEGLLTKHVVIE